MAEFEIKRLQTPEGVSLAYRDYGMPDAGGDAPLTVLCLPGLTRNAKDFHGIAQVLCARYRVLALDFRGRGLSDNDPDPARYVPATYAVDVRQVLEAEGIGRVVLIGTSLGGIVSNILAAAYAAEDQSERLAGVILNDVGPVIEPEAVERIKTYVGVPVTVASLEEAAALVKLFQAMAFPDFTEAQWLEFAENTFREREPGVLTPDYDPMIAEPFKTGGVPDTDLMWQFFEALKPVPALLVHGALSDLLSTSTIKEMQRRKPDLQVATVPNRGHTPTLIEPEARQPIEAFLAALS